MSYKINKLYTVAVRHNTVFSFSLILKTIYCGPSDHHLVILQKLNLRYMQCNHIVLDHMILAVVLKYT